MEVGFQPTPPPMVRLLAWPWPKRPLISSSKRQRRAGAVRLWSLTNYCRNLARCRPPSRRG